MTSRRTLTHNDELHPGNTQLPTDTECLVVKNLFTVFFPRDYKPKCHSLLWPKIVGDVVRYFLCRIMHY